MIDKEIKTSQDEVIIDGINVCRCEFYPYVSDDCREYGKYQNNPNCDYKQLRRKEQECEELKEELKDMTVRKIEYLNESLKHQIECDRYKKALEKIEEIAVYYCNTCKELEPEKCKPSNCRYCNYHNILQLIDKVKDEQH